ncbi:MAG: hypothetical protein K0S22_2582 [Oscillospiraceae bacterium]|nr:hypothetical protein [Oscillospiraceae bacterium]
MQTKSIKNAKMFKICIKTVPFCGKLRYNIRKAAIATEYLNDSGYVISYNYMMTVSTVSH